MSALHYSPILLLLVCLPAFSDSDTYLPNFQDLPPALQLQKKEALFNETELPKSSSLPQSTLGEWRHWQPAPQTTPQASPDATVPAAPAVEKVAEAPKKETTPATPPVVEAPKRVVWQLPLISLRGQQKYKTRLPPFLDVGIDSRSSKISFTLSDRDLPAESLLNLVFRGSLLLGESRARLEVLLNGVLIGQPSSQESLSNPDASDTSVHIEFAAKLLKPGTNTLEFVFVGGLAQSGDDTFASEADNPASLPSFQVDLEDSFFEFTNPETARDAPALLSGLKTWMAPKPGKAYPIHFAIPQTPPLDDEILTAGALVAQGVALRLPTTAQYSLSYSPRLRRAQDNILIGTLNNILPYIPEDAPMPPYQGPSVSIYHLPGDKTAALLVITGPKAQDVMTAARAFAAARFMLPPASSTIVDSPKDYIFEHAEFKNDLAQKNRAGGALSKVSNFLAKGKPNPYPTQFALQVHLLDGDPRSVTAMWDFVGQIARNTRSTLLNLTASFNPIPQSVDGLHVQVGLLSQWSAAERGQHAIRLGEEGIVQYSDTLYQEQDGVVETKTSLPTLGRGIPVAAFNAGALMIRPPPPAPVLANNANADAAHPPPSLLPSVILTAASPQSLKDSVECLQTLPLREIAMSGQPLFVWSPQGLFTTPVCRQLFESTDLFQSPDMPVKCLGLINTEDTESPLFFITYRELVIVLAVLAFILLMAVITSRIFHRHQRHVPQ